MSAARPTRTAVLDTDSRAHVAGGPASALLARQVLRRLPSAGEPLAAATRAAYADAGHDLSHVRVHRDAYAADTARAFGARALTSGSHVLLGTARTGVGADRVLVHEFGHAVAQRRTGEPVVQLDAIDKVRDLLSYGVLDWAVTDSEAMESLALLGALPDDQLTAGLARLESKYVDRLLDNLPDAARSGPGYQRVVQALGVSRTVGNAVSNLSYGLFDWAVTDTDVIGVYNTFVNLAPAQQEPFVMALEKAGRFGRLVSNSSAGHLSLYLHPWIRGLTRGHLTTDQLMLMRTIVRETDDLPTLVLAASVRFDMTVGPTIQPTRTAAPWKADILRRTYLTLDQLPEAHTAGNKELTGLGQFTEAAGADGWTTRGVYLRSAKELAINTNLGADPEGTMRHETGHSVDYKIGWRTSAEPGKSERGGWKTYTSQPDTATDMVADAAAGISGLTAPQQADVVAEIATSMANQSTTGLVARVRARPWYAGLAAPARRAVRDDPTFDAVTVGLADPWKREDGGGKHLGTHIYQQGYTPNWVRYEHAARARKVSLYQFSKPGEWFAEAYSWYYAPDERGKGMKLNDKDPNTKQWFDANVDKGAGVVRDR